MKYEVTYQCGHTGIVDLGGKESDRQYRLQRLAQDDCPECKRKANMDILAADMESGMAELTGSDKQIAWAATIRHSIMEDMDAYIGGVMRSIPEGPDADEAMQCAELVCKALREEYIKASWWIDHRSSYMEQIFCEVYDAIKDRATKVEVTEDGSVQAEAMAEATVTPEDCSHNITVEISAQPSRVQVTSPKNEDLRQLLRSLSYRFDRDLRCWVLPIGSTTGTSECRAAELGNRLLHEGYRIRIYDEALRVRAINADYAPRHTRWVVQIKGEDNVLGIRWDGQDDDIYQSVKRIPGAKWRDGKMVVPISSCDAIEDLVDLMDFRLTPGAAELIDAYKSHLPSAVSPAAAPVPAPTEDKLQAILNSNRDVLPDLKDD